MRAERTRWEAMAVPLLVAALVSASVRLLGLPSEDWSEREFLNELGWPWMPLCAIGMFGALVAARSSQALVAMFTLLPFWVAVAGAVGLGIHGMSVTTTNCGPASRETIALGSLGEIYGTYVLAFAWSAALSLYVALSTLRNGRRDERGPSLSLLLAGLSFAAAGLQAGALRGTIFVAAASEHLDSLAPRSLQVSRWGVLAGGVMFAALLVAGITAPRLASSPRRVVVLSALFLVPLLSWGVALSSRQPIVDFIHERLPLVRPLESVAADLAQPSVPSWRTRGWSVELGARADGQELKRVLATLWRAGAVNVKLVGSAGSLSQPLPLEALEHRVAFAPVVTTIRLRGAGQCETCAVSVKPSEGGLLAQREDGSTSLWKLSSADAQWDARRAPGADFVRPFPADVVLLGASLIAEAHGHVLVVAVE